MFHRNTAVSGHRPKVVEPQDARVIGNVSRNHHHQPHGGATEGNERCFHVKHLPRCRAKARHGAPHGETMTHLSPRRLPRMPASGSPSADAPSQGRRRPECSPSPTRRAAWQTTTTVNVHAALAQCWRPGPRHRSRPCRATRAPRWASTITPRSRPSMTCSSTAHPHRRRPALPGRRRTLLRPRDDRPRRRRDRARLTRRPRDALGKSGRRHTSRGRWKVSGSTTSSSTAPWPAHNQRLRGRS